MALSAVLVGQPVVAQVEMPSRQMSPVLSSITAQSVVAAVEVETAAAGEMAAQAVKDTTPTRAMVAGVATNIQIPIRFTWFKICPITVVGIGIGLTTAKGLYTPVATALLSQPVVISMKKALCNIPVSQEVRRAITKFAVVQ